MAAKTHGLHLRSPLSTGECRRRLERVAVEDTFDLGVTDAPMIVTVERDRFTVVNDSDDLGWRMFRRIFYGQLEPDRGGTIVRGRFRLHPIARIGLAVWFFAMGATVMLLVAGAVAGPVHVESVAAGILTIGFPVAMIAAAAAVVRWSIARSRHGDRAILTLITALVEGAPPDH